MAVEYQTSDPDEFPMSFHWSKQDSYQVPVDAYTHVEKFCAPSLVDGPA